MTSVIIGMSFLVLVLAIIVATFGAAIAGIGLGYQLSSLIFLILLTGTAMQLGYLFGIIGHALVSHRLRQRRVGWPSPEAARQIGAVAVHSDSDVVTFTAETAPAVSPAALCPSEDVFDTEFHMLGSEGAALVPSSTASECHDVQQPSHHSPARARRIAGLSGFFLGPVP